MAIYNKNFEEISDENIQRRRSVFASQVRGKILQLQEKHKIDDARMMFMMGIGSKAELKAMLRPSKEDGDGLALKTIQRFELIFGEPVLAVVDKSDK